MERTRVNRRSADLAADLLDDGWSLVIFPEGGRSPDGWAQEFRGGAAYLALRSGRPLVPVLPRGHPQCGRRAQRLPRPRKVDGDVRLAHLRPTRGEDARRLAARIEAAVAALADERSTDWWTARRRAADGTTPAITGPEAAAWRRAWALRPPRLRDNASGRRRPVGEHIGQICAFPRFGGEYGTECHRRSDSLVSPPTLGEAAYLRVLRPGHCKVNQFAAARARVFVSS